MMKTLCWTVFNFIAAVGSTAVDSPSEVRGIREGIYYWFMVQLCGRKNYKSVW